MIIEPVLGGKMARSHDQLIALNRPRKRESFVECLEFYSSKALMASSFGFNKKYKTAMDPNIIPAVFSSGP